jgi:flagellar hook protein FlgE
MSANGSSLSVIGDNIANMNTVAFKASRTTFGDVLSQTVTGVAGSDQVGRGVSTSSVSPLFTQGSFESTASALDMAIEGDGFFMVSDGIAKYYTRAGQFNLDKNGNIVNPDGLIMQGYVADEAGNITGAMSNMNVSASQSRASATADVNIAVNLESGADQTTWNFTAGANPPDPASYHSATTVTVYDSQGGSHDVTAYFVKTGANGWSAHYVYKDGTGNYAEAGSQNLTFGTDGSLTNDNSSTAANFNFGAAVTTPQAITFNYGSGTAEATAGSGFEATTQFASPFAVTKLTQDGFASGALKNLMIGDDGVITGIFTNGQTRVLGQVALAKFVAPTGLSKLGKNLFAESYESGQPIIGKPSSSGIGKVLANTIELSNVDLAEEFVKMIAAQRGFQANSRMITTTDELMQELVNLKR